MTATVAQVSTDTSWVIIPSKGSRRRQRIFMRELHSFIENREDFSASNAVWAKIYATQGRLRNAYKRIGIGKV